MSYDKYKIFLTKFSLDFYANKRHKGAEEENFQTSSFNRGRHSSHLHNMANTIKIEVYLKKEFNNGILEWGAGGGSR